MKYLLVFVVVTCLFPISAISMASQKYTRKPGYCMWYGECGISSTTKKPINCLYNGKAKKIADKESQEILNNLCPELSNGSICCSLSQLYSLQSGIQSAKQIMARCPSCWKNFRQLYCLLTCSANNSLFIDPTDISENKKAIEKIDYYVDPSFRNGLYNSCKDVQFPNSNTKIMSFLCGVAADKCNPMAFLTFMGDPKRNGQSAFTINYPVNTTSHLGIKAMNQHISLCNETVYDPRTNKTLDACSCQDCLLSCAPLPSYCITQMIFSIKPTSEFYNKNSCYYGSAPGCQITGPIIRKQFLLKILRVQNYLINMAVKFDSSYINLQDICMKPLFPYNNNCTVISVPQYWQNDEKKLNACISFYGPGIKCADEGWDAIASWGDHLVACLNNPTATDDGTKLHQSCRSLFGGPVAPSLVFGGYPGKQYTEANIIYATFVIKNQLDESENDKAKAWEKKFIEYTKHYWDKDLEIIVSKLCQRNDHSPYIFV